ncbi:MAG: ATP-dependent RNA helicase HrpA [Frankiaceae bacterium]
MLRDRWRLQRRLDGTRKLRDSGKRAAALAAIEAEIGAAEERVAGRRAAVPAVGYPEELPVSRRRDDILAAIRDHQVVIVAGETGSGKTTQLPKICLELGRGVLGTIGHTQPRRIAARTVAERIADELGTPLGEVVGYKVRFTDRTGGDTLVKVMTDGILLAEIQSDRMLSRYDTIIVDEAHERSLNVDFILGYLKQLLPRRPDLKVVITSATIDVDRFSRHFGGAPVVEVTGRSYPVEVRYRPLRGTGEDGDGEEDDGERDQARAICDAVDELCAKGQGDVLVFLSGEREIRDAADALKGRRDPRGGPLEVLPLYARLSAAEQHRVFAPHAGRRVVLATNVAETSLTVPGIRYVVDPGTARISRYSRRTKVQRLPIEPISRASADQRAGRCGRVADGICIRLYAEEDYASRPQYTDPEILRTNLASVILQMTALGLGDVAAFPFVQPPDRRSISDGEQLLEELGALEPATEGKGRRLTGIGRALVALPVDPRLGRMVLEADRNGCLDEVIVIVAGLAIQDPRERPAPHRQAADESHARFADESSDFLAYLNLWRHLRERQRALSGNQFRRLCRAEHLNFLRVREWQDVVGQLREVARGLGLTPGSGEADPRRIHMSLLAGLLSHIGYRDAERQDYAGARGARFAVFPGSALFRKAPRWVMAAELVETSRLWARVVARIEPEWAESLGAHLVKRSYSEPHWDRKRGAVMAYERVTLYGLPIVASRRVPYAPVDPQVARELFIRCALVEGDWDAQHAFLAHNQEMLRQVEALEDRVRRRGIAVGEERLFELYDERIPAGVVSARHFDSWWKRARKATPGLLDLTTGMLIDESAGDVGSLDERDHPDEWQGGDLRLPLTYRFEPGEAIDGVTVHVPVTALGGLSTEGFDWHVPGRRHELVTALLRSLPKAVRRSFVPAPDVARAVLDRLSPGDGPLLPALEHELLRMTGVAIPPGSWQLDRLPPHLRMTFLVHDAGGRELASGKDLDELRERLAPDVRAAIAGAARAVERAGSRSWTFGTVPRSFEARQDGHAVTGYPALVDEGDAVAVRALESPAEQDSAMRRGTRRLLLLTVPSPLRAVHRTLDNRTKLSLARSPYPGARELLDDCVVCAVDGIVAESGGPAWDEEGFGKLQDRVRTALVDVTGDVVTTVARILDAAHAVRAAIPHEPHQVLQPAIADVEAQLDALVHSGFVSETGLRRLPDIPRYVTGISRRLEAMRADPARDLARMGRLHELEQEYRDVVDALPPAARDEEAVRSLRWMLEELRVSYFAQALGTAHPVSDKRVLQAIDRLWRGR